MRRPPRNLTIVVTVLAVAAVVGFWAARGGGGDDQGSQGPGSPVVARIAVDDSPRQALLAADGLWVVGERALYRIDPSSNRVVATIPVGTVVAAPAAVALAADAAWVPAGASTTLWRVDRDLTAELRAWPTDTWAALGVDLEDVAAALVGCWRRGDVRGLRLRLEPG